MGKNDYIKPFGGEIRKYDGTYTNLATALGLTLAARDVANANDGRHDPMLSTIKINDLDYDLYDVLTAIKDAIALSDTMTTRGDMLYQAAAAPARLAKGTSGYVLMIGANDPAWTNPDSLTISDTGSLLTATTLLGQLQELAALIARIVALEGEYLIIPTASIPTTEAALYEGLKIFDTTADILKVVATPGEQELDSITFTAGAVTQSGNITIALNSVNKTVAVVGGTAHVANCTIATGASASGNLTVTLNGVAHAAIAVVNGDTAAQVSGKITAAYVGDATWTVGNIDAVLTFTAIAKGAMAGAFTLGVAATGVTSTLGITETTPGIDTDSAIAVATKVRAASYTGWTTGGTAGTAIVTFTKNAVGACSAPTLTDTDGTGVAASAGFTRTNQGVTTVMDNIEWTAVTLVSGTNVTWGTAEPATTTYVMRYMVMNKVCFVNVYIASADGNDASSLVIALPVAPKDNNAFSTLSGLQLVNATWSVPMPYIDDGASAIGFYNFSACTNGQACKFIVTGQYEIA